ncbi:hypothetical protein PGH43_13115 [Legionella pneumophila 130b]|nr:hypothetical protein PGH43_13115 [Legionella pneumophila 130b]
MMEVVQNLFFIGKGIVLTMQLLTGGMLIGVLLGFSCQFADIKESLALL